MLYSYFKTRANVYAERFQRGLGKEIKGGGVEMNIFDKLHGYSHYNPALINVTVYLSLFVSFLHRLLCSITFLYHIEKFKMGAGGCDRASPKPPSVSTLEMLVFLNPHFLDVTFYIIEKYNCICTLRYQLFICFSSCVFNKSCSKTFHRTSAYRY